MATRTIPEDEIAAALNLLAKGGRSNAAVFEDLTKLTSRIPPENIAPFESLLRWKIVSLKYHLRPKWWQFWRTRPNFPEWVSIASENGYEREKGIRATKGGAPNAIFFALLVRRLNDWVPEVRAAAGSKIVAIAEETDPHIVVNVLSVILSRWNSWRRWSDSEKHKLVEIVELEKVSVALYEKITTDVSGPMAQVLAQACRCNCLDSVLPDIAVGAIQPAVRAKAYRMLLERKAVWIEGRKWKWTDIRYNEGRYDPVLGERKIQNSLPAISTIESALKDKSVVVRRVGAEKFIENLKAFGPRAEPIAGDIARDKSDSVAERGRFALRNLGADDCE